MPTLHLDHVQIAMPAGEEAAARRFYGELLGLPEIPKPPALLENGGCWFAAGQLQLHLGVAREFTPARKAHPALLVPDLDALLERLAAAGAPITPDARVPGVRRAYVADPFGNRLELIQDGQGFSQAPPEEEELEPPAADLDEVRRRHADNREGWNEGAQAYTAGLEDALAALRRGESNIHPRERALLGDLRAWCGTAIHLQCASGRDTLSLWLEGAHRVIGVDISDVHIANARRLSTALQAPAEWHRCDVLDTPESLTGQADLVYTGRGALCWLHDLKGWAQVIARLLKPGGMALIFDEHPASWLFDNNVETYQYANVDYFQFALASRGWPDAYIGSLGRPRGEHARKHERLWPLSEIFQALTAAGLRIEHLGEYPDEYWDVFPNLRSELRGKIPLTMSLLARKP